MTMISKAKQKNNFAICIKSNDPDLLTPRMIYQVLKDEKAEKSDYIRIIDNEGEDYLYPSNYFIFIDLPSNAKKIFLDKKYSKEEPIKIDK